MALHTHTLSFSAFSAVCTPLPRNSLPILNPSSTLPFPNIRLRSHGVTCSSSSRWIPTANHYYTRRVTRLRSADEGTLVPEQEDEQTSSQPEVDGEPSSSENDQQPVVVPVSPADTLTMFFQVLLQFWILFLLALTVRPKFSFWRRKNKQKGLLMVWQFMVFVKDVFL